jgi:hypothetical protein
MSTSFSSAAESTPAYGFFTASAGARVELRAGAEKARSGRGEEGARG